MRISSLYVFLGFFLWNCENPKSFEDRIIGDWQIENPTLQSYIRFDKGGEVTYFFNRFSYEKDSLAEYGRWQLQEILSSGSLDTFAVEIIKKPQNTLFKLVFVSPNKIKVMDSQGTTYFTRVQQKSIQFD